MASKGHKRRQNNVNLQDESLMLQSRMTSTEDHLTTAHAQSFMRNRGNTSFTARTQVGRRIYHGYMHEEQAPSARHNQNRDGNIPSLGSAGLIQKNTMENQNKQLTDDHRVAGEFVSGGFEQEDEEGSDIGSETMEKETRGPTYMQSIWGRPPNLPLIHVEYNEFGQPIGGENSKLCHFLGSLARNGKYCPIDVKNWHTMPRTKKAEMLDVVKLRFHVPIIAEKWILTSIGHKWRNWKHYLKTRYWADVPCEHLIDERDDRVLRDQWVTLLSHWRTEEAKKVSDRNKNARGKKIMNQRTGKTSFAQIKARLSAMQELSNQLEDSEDVISPNDIFSQIMGKDKSGHVRMLGQGISPSDVWSETPKSNSNRLLLEHQEKIAQLEAMLLAQKKSRASQVDTRQDTLVSDPLSPHATTTLPLQVGTYVSLKSLFTKKVVAKGCVHNTNPNTKVGGQMLGENWYEVNVKVIVEPDEQLVRPYDNFQKLSQTLGEMIAWPCSLVTPTQY